MIIALPVVLSGGSHINLLVGRQIASYYDGAIAWLNYADRLYPTFRCSWDSIRKCTFA